MIPTLRCARCQWDYVADGVRLVTGKTCQRPRCGGLLVRTSSPFGPAPVATPDPAANAWGVLRDVAANTRSAYSVARYTR